MEFLDVNNILRGLIGISSILERLLFIVIQQKTNFMEIKVCVFNPNLIFAIEFLKISLVALFLTQLVMYSLSYETSTKSGNSLFEKLQLMITALAQLLRFKFPSTIVFLKQVFYFI